MRWLWPCVPASKTPQGPDGVAAVWDLWPAHMNDAVCDPLALSQAVALGTLTTNQACLKRLYDCGARERDVRAVAFLMGAVVDHTVLVRFRGTSRKPTSVGLDKENE